MLWNILWFVAMKVRCLTSSRAVCGINTKWWFTKLLLPSSISQTAQPGNWRPLFQVGHEILCAANAAERKGGKAHQYITTKILNSKPEFSDFFFLIPQVRWLLDPEHFDLFSPISSRALANGHKRWHRVILDFLQLQEIGVGGKAENLKAQTCQRWLHKPPIIDIRWKTGGYF